MDYKIKSFFVILGFACFLWTYYHIFIFEPIKEARKKAITKEEKDKLDIEAKLFWSCLWMASLMLLWSIFLSFYSNQISEFTKQSWLNLFIFMLPLIFCWPAVFFCELHFWTLRRSTSWLVNYIYRKKQKKANQKLNKDNNK